MDALTALHSRNSVNLLCDPAPSEDQLENIFKAGLRACDHKNLKPWKYLLIEGDARKRFGQLMVDVKTAMQDEPLDSCLTEKLLAKPFRAPTIVVVVARVQVHEKVPEIEQVLSAGASSQMMMTAAHAQGIGAIWRSGALMFRPEMRDGLGLEPQDQIVGFLYLGAAAAAKPVSESKTKDFVSRWLG